MDQFNPNSEGKGEGSSQDTGRVAPFVYVLLTDRISLDMLFMDRMQATNNQQAVIISVCLWVTSENKSVNVKCGNQ